MFKSPRARAWGSSAGTPTPGDRLKRGSHSDRGCMCVLIRTVYRWNQKTRANRRLAPFPTVPEMRHTLWSLAGSTRWVVGDTHGRLHVESDFEHSAWSSGGGDGEHGIMEPSNGVDVIVRPLQT